MKTIPFTALTCPLDNDPLAREGNSWRCTNGHCFDIAKQGYTNLLPVQNKRTLDPGDSKEMVAARLRFLNAGFYQPIAETINRLTLDGLENKSVASCLDAGSGEGYYLRQLIQQAATQQNVKNIESARFESVGVDISKWAVLSSAKQDSKAPCANWLVASNAKLPVLDSSIDRVLCIFGFPVYSEFARVLKSKGVLIQVDSGPKHLIELREIIYPELKPEKIADNSVPAGFSLAGAETLTFTIKLTQADQVADLLAMTPHLYRASAEGREKARKLTSLSLTVDIRFTCLQRD